MSRELKELPVIQFDAVLQGRRFTISLDVSLACEPGGLIDRAALREILARIAIHLVNPEELDALTDRLLEVMPHAAPQPVSGKREDVLLTREEYDRCCAEIARLDAAVKKWDRRGPRPRRRSGADLQRVK